MNILSKSLQDQWINVWDTHTYGLTSAEILVSSVDILVSSVDILVSSVGKLGSSVDILVSSVEILVSSVGILVSSGNYCFNLRYSPLESNGTFKRNANYMYTHTLMYSILCCFLSTILVQLVDLSWASVAHRDIVKFCHSKKKCY